VTTPPVFETVEYRVVLVDSASRLMLALDSLDGYRLLRVKIPPCTRAAEQLRRAIRAAWKLEVLILDFPLTEGDSVSCAVAEVLSLNLTSGLKAIALDQLTHSELSASERMAVQAVLTDATKSPVSRIGWIKDAIVWAEDVVGRKVSQYDIEQLNGGRGFALMRFRTEDGAHYWPKATGEPQQHELPVTALLSRLCEGHLPCFLSSRPDWNAWLMSGETPALTSLPEEPFELSKVLGNIVASMANLQKKTVGWETHLLGAGAFDQRLDVLVDHSELLFSYLEEAMSLQTSTKAPHIDKRRLQELRGILECICERMDDLDLPCSIVHGDMSLHNILLGVGCCQFIDWCEAYVGNPLITFQHLLLLNQMSNHALKVSIDGVLKARYRTAMTTVCEPRAIDVAFVYMPFLAAVSALYGRIQWLTTAQRDDPRRQAYARCLARHMHRAANAPGLLEALETSDVRRTKCLPT
jgi:RIO1 family